MVPNFASSFNLASGKNITLSAARKAVSGSRFQQRKAEGKQTKEDKEIEAGIAALEGSEPKTNPLRVRADSKFGMFIPQLNRTGKPVLQRVSKASGSKQATGVFKKGNARIPYSLEGAFNIFGPMIPEGVDEAEDPEAENLTKNVKNSIIDNARRFADTLIPATKRGKAKKSEIKQKLGLGSSQEGAAGGAKGAINAAIGAAFEAAVLTGLNLNPPKVEKGKGDFDIVDINKKVKKLFLDDSFSSIKKADLKSSASGGNITSFIKKIANEQYGSLAAMQAAMDPNKGTSKKAVKRNKGGIIPNFTLGRKIADSKIRIHKDMMTGQPLAVTNIEDEPRGLRDAIDRERNGIPLGAMGGGLVPNYAGASMSARNIRVGGGNRSQLPQLGGGIMARGQAQVAASLNVVDDSVKKFGGSLEKASMGLFAVQMGLGMLSAKSEEAKQKTVAKIEADMKEIKASGENSKVIHEQIKAKREELKSVQESTTAQTSLAEAANIAITALMSAQALNAVSGGFFGRAGKGALGLAGKGLGATGGLMAKGPQAARIAGKLGPKALGGTALAGVTAAGIGGFQILSAANKDDLKAGERKDMAKKGRNALGGAVAGAAIGSLVPVIGTAIGAAIGGGIGLASGMFIKGGAEQDAKSAARQAQGEQTLRIAQGSKSVRDQLGFDGNQKQFENLIDDNLANIEKQEGGAEKALAIRERLDKARELQAQVMGDETATEIQKAQVNLELLRANKLALSLKHDTFEAEANALSEFKRLSKAEFSLDRKLAEAKRKLAAAQIDRMKMLKGEQRTAEMNVGLSSAIKGPFADNVKLASEQNLTQRNLAIGKEDIRAAQDKLDAADPSDENFSKLKNDVETASEKFKDAVAKAGVGLVQKMRQVADALTEAREKGKELETQRTKIIEGFINDVVSGRKTGDFSEAVSMVKALEAGAREVKVILDRERKKAQRNLGDDFKEEDFLKSDSLRNAIGQNRARELSQMAMDAQTAANRAGSGKIAENFIQNALPPMLRSVLESTASARKAAVTTGLEGLGDERARNVLGADTKDIDEQINQNTQALISLKLQLDQTQGAFKKLEEQVSETDAKGIPAQIKRTVTAMTNAAKSTEGVQAFAKGLNDGVKTTTDFLAKQGEFVKQQDILVGKMTDALKIIQDKLDDISGK